MIKKGTEKQRLKQIGLFGALYLISTLLIVPFIAPVFGREKIKESEVVSAHSLFYKLANRNYVNPELNKAIQNIAKQFEQKNSRIKLKYLDANFPFINKFPLLPHLSHNDGKKIDVSLIYSDNKGQLTNKKKSVSGYGVFEGPKNQEFDQISVCKEKGNWLYDFPKYLTLGTVNKSVDFSESATRELVNIIVNQNEIGKLFIEPHLKTRMNLNSGKVRFHGCKAVRHDDHIHFQLK